MSDSYSEEIAKKSGSNFYPAFFFLSKEKRAALSSIYAFSRLVDDAVDHAVDLEKAKRELSQWRDFLNHCYEPGGSSKHPLYSEIKETIQHYEIPKQYFEDLLRGVEMDLTKKRYESFSELETYCYHVAGTVGLLCNQIFGRPTESHHRYAISLGTAFQLTNIIRDVGLDLERDRVYLPLEDLRFYAYSVEELQKGIMNEKYDRMMEFQTARTQSYFDQARLCLSKKERREITPAVVMTRFYEAILHKVQKKRFQVLNGKISLSPLKKAWILGTSFF